MTPYAHLVKLTKRNNPQSIGRYTALFCIVMLRVEEWVNVRPEKIAGWKGEGEGRRSFVYEEESPLLCLSFLE